MHRHQYNKRKLSRKSGPRKALLRGLATSVILYERIKTTQTKAKEVQPIVEKLITLAKKGDLASIRAISSYLYGENAVQKLVTEIAPIYKERNGGYTRIVKLGNRPGDNAPVVILEIVDIDKLVKASVPQREKKSATTKELAKVTSAKTSQAVKKPTTKKVVAKKSAPKEKK
jgi:large subunit ribosomal protein L17